MTNVSLIDVRHLDGEAWQVAEVAGKQAAAAVRLAEEAMQGLWWAARGSWMSQEDHRTGTMPDGADFPDSALGRKLQAAHDALNVAKKATEVATLAASHDPRST